MSFGRTRDTICWSTTHPARRPQIWISWADGRRVHIARLEGTTLDLESASSVEHDRAIAMQSFDAQGRRLATSDTGGTIRVWSLHGDPPELTHTFSGEGGSAALAILLDSSGTRLAAKGDGSGNSTRRWGTRAG